MKIRNLVGDRFKERPSDCVIDSHALMVRGGYMKYVANGIFSLYAPGKRVTQKIEKIIREEMDRIDGQEVMFPVVLPGSLWEESGRFTSVGDELIRLKDRNNSSLVLGMTHEEAAVHLAREYGNSYSRYPFMIYQIQTKFRDEARPRAGLLRVREFVMKDAYSFHTSQEDLERYYEICFEAYNRIFARAGIPEVVAVKSDSGMMGGRVSHEFMLLTPVGEDNIAICDDCGYKANMEATDMIIENEDALEPAELTKVHTPGVTSIEDVIGMLRLPVGNSCKAVVYQKNIDDSYVVIFIRGDLEVNETKITNYLGEGIHPAKITEDCGLHAGYIGPYGLEAQCTVLYDKSLEGIRNLCCGANCEEYHYTGLNIGRDCGEVAYHDFAKVYDGAICPVCGKKSIRLFRGIEVGNIFQLGTKYTESMNMQYVDKDGAANYPIMGCYGIGVGRLAASVCEAHHDENGPIWPISIAPWQVHLCCIRVDDEDTRKTADQLYEQLLGRNIEVIYDDRDVRAGVMFSDADLIGVPVRVIVSPRNLKEGIVEIVTRDKAVQEKVALDDAVSCVEKLIARLYAEIEEKGQN
ncbi:proline--tRNA ligase [Lachnospiraceae bacterium JLR.KK008]